MPASRQPRITRTAISPRLATSTRRIGRLEGDVAMLLGRVLIALVANHLQRGDELGAGLRRLDDLVDVSTGGCNVRIGQTLAILGLESPTFRVRIGRIGQLVAEDDVDRALHAHDRDLRRWPGVVDVATDVLATHDVIGAAVRLTRDQRELGYGGLAIRIQQLGAVANDPALLLDQTGHEAWDIYERDQRDIE